jgi:hypothetical protein
MAGLVMQALGSNRRGKQRLIVGTTVQTATAVAHDGWDNHRLKWQFQTAQLPVQMAVS